MLAIVVKRSYQGDNDEDSDAFGQLFAENNPGLLNLHTNSQQQHQ